MSYDVSKLNKILDLDFSGGASLYRYRSSDSSTQITATGYFAKAGAASRSNDNRGMKLGDVVLNQESSGGATPGRCTFHGVTGSTADQSSTTASTGYSASYNVTVAAAST